MMRARPATLAALLAAALVAGCADQGGERPGGQAGQAPTTAGEATTTAPATTAGGAAGTTGAPARSTTPPPSTARPAGGEIRVSGTVQAGVEPGCLLLDASQSEPYLLVDGDPAVLRPGTRVEVTGVLIDNVMSICQQGRPLSVTSARPI